MTQSLSSARQQLRSRFQGYFTVLYTPFSPDGEIDEAALRQNVEVTLSLPGVGGLAINSLHQEFWAMDNDERKRIAECVIQAVAGRVPTVVGCSDPAYKTVVDLARHAEAAGADAVMVWPPYYGVRTPAGVQAFYERVAEKINIGMLVYSATLAELGFYLTPAMVERLLPIDNVCAVMNTTLNLSSYADMLERVGDRIPVTTSLEEYFLFGKLAFPERTPDFLFGSSRPLFAQSLSHPHCGDFIDAVRRGDFTGAAALSRKIMAIANKLQSRYFAQGFHNVALSKQITSLFGLQAGAVRPPLSPSSAEEFAECVEILRHAGLVSGVGS